MNKLLLKQLKNETKNEKQEQYIEFYINNNKKNKLYYNLKDNIITTTKYNIFTFIPKGLLYQFSRLSNIYFLFTAIIQSIPLISPLTSITAIKAQNASILNECNQLKMEIEQTKDRINKLIMKKIKEKTGIEGIYVIIFLAICVILVYFGIFESLITSLVGTLYPGFSTIKAIQKKKNKMVNLFSYLLDLAIALLKNF